MTVFGLKLGLTLAEIEVIKADTRDTKLHGLQIYTAWRKKQGDQLTKKDHDQLSEAFARSGHRRKYFTLFRKRPKTIVGQWWL